MSETSAAFSQEVEAKSFCVTAAIVKRRVQKRDVTKVLPSILFL